MHTATAKSTKRFRVHFHFGVDVVTEVNATSAQAAREQVEGTFPAGQGWYVIKVEEVNPDANLEPGTRDEDTFVAFPIF